MDHVPAGTKTSELYANDRAFHDRAAKYGHLHFLTKPNTVTQLPLVDPVCGLANVSLASCSAFLIFWQICCEMTVHNCIDELFCTMYLAYRLLQAFAVPSVPVEDMDPIVAVVVIAGHLARLSTAYFPKPSNLKSEDGFTGEVSTPINSTPSGTLILRISFCSWIHV